MRIASSFGSEEGLALFQRAVRPLARVVVVDGDDAGRELPLFALTRQPDAAFAQQRLDQAAGGQRCTRELQRGGQQRVRKAQPGVREALEEHLLQTIGAFAQGPKKPVRYRGVVRDGQGVDPRGFALAGVMRQRPRTREATDRQDARGAQHVCGGLVDVGRHVRRALRVGQRGQRRPDLPRPGQERRRLTIGADHRDGQQRCPRGR